MPDSPRSLKLTLPPLSAAAPGTLYEQVIAGLKSAISTGKLRVGEALPSFRKLAKNLLVSVITIKRAYVELEREGIIFRRQGLGTFVAEGGVDRNRSTKLERSRSLLVEARREASEAGLNAGEIRSLFLEAIEHS